MIRILKEVGSRYYHLRCLHPSLPQFLAHPKAIAGASDYCLRLRYGSLPLLARSRDYWGVREVLVDEIYSEALSQLEGTDAPTVIDGGANIGAFSLYTFRRFPRARCLSFEASNATHQVLKRNQCLNPNLDWKTFHAAFWKEVGYARFEGQSYSTGGRIDDSGEEIVPTLDLAAVLDLADVGQIDLMKLDIEGAEQAFLQGGEELLRQVRRVLVEVHPALCDGAAVEKALRTRYARLQRLRPDHGGKPVFLAWNG